MKHKHAEVIQAAINNRFIQIRTKPDGNDSDWKPPVSGHVALERYTWNPDMEYRIAMQSVNKYRFVYKTENGYPGFSDQYFKDEEEFKKNYPTTKFDWIFRVDPTVKVFEEEFK